MAALGFWLRDQLDRRSLSIPEFVKRSGLSISLIYQITRDQKTNIRQATLEKIARALDYPGSAALLRAVEGSEEIAPVERAVRHRGAELREVLSRVAPRFWDRLIDGAFDRALDDIRDRAALIRDLTQQ